MENDKLKNIKPFVDSATNSEAEHEFTANELQAYFDQKLRHKYAKRLDKEFDIRKQNISILAAKKGPGFKVHYLILALAGVLLAFAVYHFLNNWNKKESNKPIAYKNELYMPVDINVRGKISDQQQLVNTLNNAYVEKDFANVIAEYQKLKSDDGPYGYDLNVEQMAGIAYASIEKYDEAINIFKGILRTKESSYSNHSTVRYLLGLVYLLNSDQPNAIETLQQTKKGDYKYDEVQSILEQL